MKKLLLLTLALVLCVTSSSVWAEEEEKELLIPVSGMQITITPKQSEDKDAKPNDLLGIKKVTVFRRRSNVLRATWYSLVRELAENTVYPTYVIQTRKGILDVSNLSHKTAFLNPILWPNGYLNTITSLPLWMDPAYLSLKRRQKRNFFIGLVQFNTDVVANISVEYREPLLFFKNLYDQFIKAGKVRDNIEIKRSEEKRLERFVEEFFFVSEKGEGEVKVKINGVEKELKVKEVGNDYFTLFVLNDPTNPLILKLELETRKLPDAFEESFKTFKTFFEYQISEIEFKE